MVLRDDNSRRKTQNVPRDSSVVDIGDGWSMELGIVHRASTRNPPPAPGAGRGNAQTIPCGQQNGKSAVGCHSRRHYARQSERRLLHRLRRRHGVHRWPVDSGRKRTANPDGGPNGPGCGGLAVASRKVELKVGDVLIVPPGVIHGWSDIPDHVDYLSFRPSHGVMKNGWVNPTIAAK